MEHKTHCKHCRAEITLIIDDEYAQMSDPHKLIPSAVCNTCGDILVAKAKFERKIQRACTALQLLPATASHDRQDLRGVLFGLTQKFCQLNAAWRRLDHSPWGDHIVKALMKHPEEWGQTLSQVWAGKQLTLL
jgi:hypothetical protein